MRRSIVLVALVAACAAEPEDAACGGLRRTWRDTYRPPTTSAKRLVIGAGEGTTGTHTVAEWVSEARDPPLLVGHYHMGYPNYTDPERRVAHNRKWKFGPFKALMDAKPMQRATFDFDIFRDWDGVFDTPVPQLFPYIFATYPNARVILTTRNGTAWWDSRSHGLVQKRLSPVPFASLSNRPVHRIMKNEMNPTGQMRGSNALDAALLLAAHNALVRCLVPRDQLLEFDVFEEDDDAVKAKIKAFLGY